MDIGLLKGPLDQHEEALLGAWSSSVEESHPHALTEQEVSPSPEHRYLAKLETSHKFQLIADMIGITKWALVGKEFTEFIGSQYA